MVGSKLKSLQEIKKSANDAAIKWCEVCPERLARCVKVRGKKSAAQPRGIKKQVAIKPSPKTGGKHHTKKHHKRKTHKRNNKKHHKSHHKSHRRHNKSK